MEKVRIEDLVESDGINPLTLAMLISRIIEELDGGRLIKKYLEMSEFRLNTPDSYMELAKEVYEEYIEGEYNALLDNDDSSGDVKVKFEIPIAAEFKKEELEYVLSSKGSEYLSIVDLVNSKIREFVIEDGFIMATISYQGSLKIIMEY